MLTWNVWWRFGDWEARRSMIAETIGSVGADLIGLQEVWSHGGADQLAELSHAAGLVHSAWSPSRTPERWRRRVTDQPDDLQCGVAILSRWPVVDVVDRALPAGAWPSGGRTALGAVVEHPRGRLPIVSTHLDSQASRSALRVEQLATVADLAHEMMRLAGSNALAPIVCGDMNAEPESDEIRRFGGLLTAPYIDGLCFLDAWRVAGPDGDPGWTWCRGNPNIEAAGPSARIDYVFTGLAGRVAAVELVGRAETGLSPSDHLGVVADLRP